jgi:hypothetical protein
MMMAVAVGAAVRVVTRVVVMVLLCVVTPLIVLVEVAVEVIVTVDTGGVLVVVTVVVRRFLTLLVPLRVRHFSWPDVSSVVISARELATSRATEASVLSRILLNDKARKEWMDLSRTYLFIYREGQGSSFDAGKTYSTT